MELWEEEKYNAKESMRVQQLSPTQFIEDNESSASRFRGRLVDVSNVDDDDTSVVRLGNDNDMNSSDQSYTSIQQIDANSSFQSSQSNTRVRQLNGGMSSHNSSFTSVKNLDSSRVDSNSSFLSSNSVTTIKKVKNGKSPVKNGGKNRRNLSNKFGNLVITDLRKSTSY
jgi:hypothetical protein